VKPCCRKVIVVEGKYDKIRLDSCIHATVITTDGFGIFKNSQKRLLLRRLAEERGLVILSDPDGAGGVIRSYLNTLTGGKGITHLYVPPIPGRERRKSTPGKEGVLGVEGISTKQILSLFEKAGLFSQEEPAPPRYTKTDLYTLGYFGKEDSKMRREEVLKKNLLPLNLSSNAFLDVVNLLEISL